MKKFSYPYIVWSVVFILFPLLLILAYAFNGSKSLNLADFQFTINNFSRFFEPLFLKILWRSLVLSFVSTALCLVIGYPIAYFISKEPEKKRNNLILFFIIPMWMNFLLRTYAWLTLLGNNGIINKVVKFLGFAPLDLMYNDKSILLGMLYNFLPFMVLPIFSVLTKIDSSLIEAAKDLGASDTRVFTKVIFPLSLPGIFTGIAMVFIPAISTFTISSLLGGNKYMLIGNLIEQQFRFTGNWGFGSAISVILILIMLVIMVGSSLFNNGDKEGGTGLW